MTHDIAALVAELPELYQPVFAHPEFDSRASRTCDDRLELAKRVYSALAAILQRPLRVLDLGSAQGYFSLHLAALGAEVVGVEAYDGNVRLSRALADEHPALEVTIEHGRLEAWLRANDLARFDLVLAFSVLHHTCHAVGAATARDLVGLLARDVPVALVELARADEPMNWAASLPANPRSLLADFPFVHRIGAFSTHISTLRRPMYFCSARFWNLGGRMDAFESWTDRQHEAAQDLFRGSRRYYFSRTKLAKHFLLDPALAETNWRELEAEAALLSTARDLVPGLPTYEAWGLEEDSAWLVRELMPGRRLSELILSGEPFNAMNVVRDVLAQLRSLEAQGLYHNDVRVWNVLLLDSGEARLIDFGSISKSRSDCSWPSDLHLSFLLFVRELVERTVPRAYPTRPAGWYSAHLEGALGRWFEAALALPTQQRSFLRLAQLLDEVESLPNADPHGDGLRSWRAAVERNLDVIGEELRHVRQWIEKDWYSQSVGHVASVVASSGHRTLPTIFDQLDAIGDAVGRSRALVERDRHLAEKIQEQVRKVSEEQGELTLRVTDLRTRATDLAADVARLHQSVARFESSLETRLTRVASAQRDLFERTSCLEREAVDMRATIGWQLLTPLTSYRRWRDARRRPDSTSNRPIGPDEHK
jgi:O-antigen chain-terminating bifunctional methyltransferase/kinase